MRPSSKDYFPMSELALCLPMDSSRSGDSSQDCSISAKQEEGLSAEVPVNFAIKQFNN